MDVLFALALGFLQAPAQTCTALDSTRPTAFLEYVKMGEGAAPVGESRRRVWLRLRNNSSCELRLPSGVRRTCTGEAVGPNLKDDECVRLPYAIFAGTPKVPVPHAVTDPNWDPAAATAPAGRLGAGASVLLTVPQAHFVADQMLAVSVADIRVGEASSYVGSSRQVLFGRGDLPPAVLAALRQH